MKNLFLLLITVFVIGCGSSSTLTVSQNPSKLSTSVIYLQLLTSSGATSVTGVAIQTGTSSAIVSGSSVRGERQAEIAAQNLAFELRSMGFRLTNTIEDSDIIGTFSIGTVRFDPLTGWIADQAFLEFSDITGEHILTVRAKTRFVTPTVDNMIKNITKELNRQI